MERGQKEEEIKEKNEANIKTRKQKRKKGEEEESNDDTEEGKDNEMKLF
jgi:hypothetical protein